MCLLNNKKEVIMGISKSPSQQARSDREKSKNNPVKLWSQMSNEERLAIQEQLNQVDREAAKIRAEKFNKRSKGA
jgi:hypothetical protein